MGKQLVAWSVFPLFMVTAMAGLAFAQSQSIPVLVTIAVGGVVFGGTVIVLERWSPHAQAWQRPREDVVTDALHLVVTGVVVSSIPGLVITEPWMSVWPDQLPVVVQVAIALLAKDFVVYWVHRLLHGPLWRFHAIHHSAQRIYWLNSWRAHPVEGLVAATAALVPLLAVGAPETVALSVWAFSSIFAMLQHSNIELHGGWLNRVFALAELHRWHHSRDPREQNSNFGAIFILWDSLFGTRYFPDRPPPIRVGIEGMDDFPTAYGAQLIAPLDASRWSRSG